MRQILEQKPSRNGCWKIGAAVGGVAGIVAICSLLVAVAQLWQAVNGQNEQNIAQSTEVANSQAQLDTLEEIKGLQEQLINQVPDATATAITNQIIELQATLDLITFVRDKKLMCLIFRQRN